MPRLPDGTRDHDKSTDWLEDTWATLSELHQNYTLQDGSKKLRAIGVCNFSTSNLKKVLASKYTKPAVNQIELHPYLPQSPLLKFCAQNDIVVTAYSPLGSTEAPLLKDETVNKIAKAHNASPAQVLISWHVAHGRSVIPKSISTERIAANFQRVDFTKEELDTLDNLAKTELGGKPKRLVKPDWGIKVFDEEDEL